MIDSENISLSEKFQYCCDKENYEVKGKDNRDRLWLLTCGITLGVLLSGPGGEKLQECLTGPEEL